MFRRILISFGAILACIAAIFLAVWLHFYFTPIVTQAAGLRYQLRTGATLKTFTANLAQEGIVTHPLLLHILARLRGSKTELKAGIYLIPAGTTPPQLLDQVTNGAGLLYQTFTIIPGWTFKQLREALHQHANLQHSIEPLSDAELMKTLGQAGVSPEGQFYADTYYYVEGSVDLKLLKRAFKRMQTKSNEAWEKREANLPLRSLYEALIAASLVEKEAHLSAERPVIAGVLLNRLQKKMLLQFDPTVIYGVLQWDQLHPETKSGFSGILRKQDLQMNTVYNTYKNKGLPPTPIAIPSFDALQAVLHPVRHDYFYFVASGSGGHQFSQTLAEHNLAVMMQRYHEQGFYNYMYIKAALLKRLKDDYYGRKIN